MAVDPAVVDAMLGPFRGMLADLQSKSLTGTDVDECAATLVEMESVAASAGDITELSTRLGVSGLYQKFSDAYTRVMMAAAAPKAGAQPTDEELLATTLRAYDDAIGTLRGTNDAEAQKAIPGIERVITLGRSGVSYPVFLRRMEEEGLSDALSGSAVLRSGLELQIGFARGMRNPIEIEKAEKLLATFDELAARAPFGVPDSFEFGLRSRRIDWEYEPALIERRMLEWRWNRLMDHLIDWLDAHAAFALYDERWAGPGPVEETKRRIRRTKESEPGRFRARERIVNESFGYDFRMLDRHELVANNIAFGSIGWSDARLDLARETYAFCVPGAVAPPELVARTEAMMSDGSWNRHKAAAQS